MLCASLFYEFFKIGLFSFGGGYATIPFLYHISQIYGWFSPEDLERMIAIASITPGPVGVNMATYTGLQTLGVVGSLLATIAISLPALIIVIIVFKVLTKFKNNKFVKAAIYGLKPASCALLASVVIKMFKTNIVDALSGIVFIVFLMISVRTKKDPLFYLVATGLISLFFKFFDLI